MSLLRLLGANVRKRVHLKNMLKNGFMTLLFFVVVVEVLVLFLAGYYLVLLRLAIVR